MFGIETDVLIDTSVISHATDDVPLRHFLIRKFNKLNAVAGNCWIASETLTELMYTPEGEQLAAIVEALLEFDGELQGGLRILEELPKLHRRELADHDQKVGWAGLGKLRDLLSSVAQSGTLKAPLLKAREQTREFLARHRKTMNEINASWRETCARDPNVRGEMEALFADFRGPQARKVARTLLECVCEGDLGWQDWRVKAELDRAEAHPEEYLSSWTWAFLVVMRDPLIAIPPAKRLRLDPYLGGLDADRNDWMDASIVGAGARCGRFVTADRDLYKRCDILYERDLIEIVPELIA
jgi:hypothetical protein